jgi:hypothetical protein
MPASSARPSRSMPSAVSSSLRRLISAALAALSPSRLVTFAMS